MGWRNAIIKFILGSLLGVSVALLAAFNVLLAWVATGPRSLDVLSPYIEIAFEPPDHKYSVSVGETWLIWDGWKHPIDVRLRNVKVFTNERHTYSKLPEISLGLDLFALVKGHILPTSLVITHPVISLFQNEDRSISFGMEAEPAQETIAPEPSAAAEEVAAVPFAAIMAPFITPDDNSVLRDLRMVSIVNADLTLSSKSKGVFFKTSGAEFTFKRNREGLRAFASANIAYDNYQSLLTAEFTKKKDSSVIEGEVHVDELMLGKLADLFADNSLLGGMKFPVSGKAMLLADMNGAVQKLNFNVDGGKGTLESNQLDGPVPVNTIHVEGQLDHNTENNASTVEISQLKADLDGTLIEASGTVALHDKNPEVHAKIAAQNIAAQKVHMFWPSHLAPMTREWVTTNISAGTVLQAQAQVNIAPGDLAKPFLPQEDVDALVVLEGAKIRYLPEHPEVSGVDGKVHIDGKSLDATLTSGHYMKDTKLTEGKVFIADLNPDNPYIKVSIAVESNAKDAIHFLELPPVSKAKKLNLIADAAEGKIKGKASLGFTFFAPRDANGNSTGDPDVDYDVAAELTGVSQAGFMHKFDGKNVDGSLTVNNKELVFKGKGDVNGASVSESTVKYLFKPDQAYDTFIDATAVAPVEVLPRFGYPAFDFLKGSLGVKASVKDGKGIESTKANIDLTNAAIAFPILYFTKPNKDTSALEISVEKKNDVLTIPSLHFTGRDLDVQGSADVSNDMSGLQHIHLDKLLSGSTKLDQLNYERTAGGFNLDMHGNVFDFSPWLNTKDSKEEGTFSFEHFPALQLKMDVARVLVAKGHELLNVKGYVTCDVSHCESANIAGATSDNKPFSFLILRNPKGKRQLSLHAQSAGQFLKAANIFDGMEGGDLTITGNYTEATADKASMLRGRLDINEHTVKDAPVLAKILTVASLTGIFDTLGGKGIHFDRLSVPFTLSKDVITLEKAKTHGDALGMTADGTITFPKGTYDLQGTIVPSYSLNHVLGNVPLIGSMLTGGEGQGVFAARYSVQGTEKDPQVSVNPLSILTPGFLRGLFDIFDRPEKEEDDGDSK